MQYSFKAVDVDEIVDDQNEMKLEIAPTFHYETVLRPALDPPLPLQQRPALRPPPLRYLDLSAVAHRACRQVTVGLPLRRQLEPPEPSGHPCAG